MNSFSIEEQSCINKAVGLVSFLNISLALLALTREILTASFLGTTAVADAFFLGYFLPDVVGNTTLGMATGLACIPVFSRNVAAMGRAASSITLVVTAGALLITTCCFFAAEPVIAWIGRGLTKETAELTLSLYRALLLLVILYPAYAIVSSLLQANLHFFTPGFGPVLFNALFVAALGALIIGKADGQKGAYVLALAICSGVAVMTAIQLIPLHALKFQWQRDFSYEHIKSFGMLFFPIVLILLSNQSILLVERILAASSGPGGIAGLNYAYKLSQFPVWTFAAAAGAVIFPLLSKYSGAGELNNFKKVLDKNLRLIIFINTPLSLIIYAMHRQVIALFFKRGAFGDSSVEITAVILAGYSLSIAAQSAVYLLIRAFYALGRMGSVLLITLLATSMTIFLDLVLVRHAGLAGIGYGATAGSTLYAILLFYKLQRQTGYGAGPLLYFLAKLVAAGIPMVLTMRIISALLPDHFFTGMMGGVIQLTLAATPGFAVYLAACAALRVEEVRYVRGYLVKLARLKL